MPEQTDERTIDECQLAFPADAHMQPVVYFDIAWVCETSCGIEVIPCDVVGRDPDADPVEQWCTLADYLEGEPDDEDSAPELREGWLAHTSAPGYLGCTAWTIHASEAEAWSDLADMYGQYPDDDDDSALGCITSIAVFWNNKATPEDWHYRVTFDGHAPETGPYAAMPLVCRDIHTCLADAVVELGVYWGVAITPGMVAVDLDYGGFAEWSTD